MDEGGEDIEIGNRSWEEEEEDDDTAETSFTLQELEEPYDAFPPNTDRFSERATTIEDEMPNVGRDVGKAKASETALKKQIFREKLDIIVNKKDGKASKELLETTWFTRDKHGNINGATFKGVRVLVSKSGGIRLSGDKSIAEAVNHYEALTEEARTEHHNTAEGAVEEAVGPPPISEEAVSDIISQAISVINDQVGETEEDLQNQAEGVFLSEQEVREFIGMLNPQGSGVEKIEALEIQAEHYREKALDEADPLKKQLYEKFIEVAELKSDSIRISTGVRPEHAEAISIVSDIAENNDLGRLERFKKWAKKNMVGLSAVAISIAGIITTIIIAARKAVLGGAKAVGSFAKAVADLTKKLGPLLAPLFNLLAQVLVWGAKGIGWLASNLWVLAVVIAWVMYDYWKNRKSGK